MPRQRKLRLEDPLRCKLVIVGCGGVGKTSLLCTYARGEFPEPYVAASFDGYVADVELPLDSIPGLNLEVWERKPGWLRRVKECFSSTFRRSPQIQSLNEEGGLNDLGLNVLNVEMALWDTAGSDDYDRLRPLSYLDAHVFLVCFSVGERGSLGYVEDKVSFYFSMALRSTRVVWDWSSNYTRCVAGESSILGHLAGRFLPQCYLTSPLDVSDDRPRTTHLNAMHLNVSDDRPKWVGEIRHFCGRDVPIILVACKSDLREDPGRREETRRGGERVVSTSEGEATAQRINALHYFEVSAKRDGVEGIGEVFVTAAKEAVRFRLKLVEEERRGRREGLNRVSGGG